ncbi:MAG: ABC transporter substrate-binding protein [Anaerolineales bacterium]
MSRNRLMTVFGVIIALAMILAACTPATTVAPTTVPATAAAPTAVPPTATPKPVRNGGWLDQVVFSVVDKASAVTQISAGAIDIYAGGLAAADFPTIKSANLAYAESNGLQYSIMYNPVTFTDKTVLNPFSDKKIREATNYLYDRNYINQEVYAGANLPMFFAITPQFPAYARVADVAAGLEAQYAYNPDKAKSIIATEMASLGATTDANGKFQYKGKPVTLNFLIRTDSDGTRKPIGDYVATQLASVGFTVNSEYKKSSEASPIWQGDPTTGAWNLYTAAYSATVIDREERVNFQEYYAPDSIQGTEPFLSNTGIDPTFAKLCDELANATYSSLDQRNQLMEQALPLSLQDSLMVFLINGKNFVPENPKVQVSYDLAAGVEGAYVAPFTLRFTGQEGGTMKWANSDLFTDPWNPIAGSNWAWDQANHNFTAMGYQGMMPDPYTGLYWPIVFDKATVTATQGLPIGKSLDWVTLNTAPSISIPDDAFVSWDAKAQKFITEADYEKGRADQAAVTKQAATIAGSVDLTTMVAPPATPAPKATPVATPTQAPLSAGAKALSAAITSLGTFYDSNSGGNVDSQISSALASSGPALEAEVANVAGMSPASAQQSEIATFIMNFVGTATGGYYQKTSQIMSSVTFQPDLFDKVTWHDGTKLSVADFLMSMIMTFDRADKNSAIYDAADVPNFQSFQQGFAAFRITSTSPLTVEYYANVYGADAELDVTTLYPWYTYGEGSWHVLAISNLAEAAGELAYSDDKATANKVEWTNYVGGPSLAIMAKYLDQAISQKYIPYAPTLGQYITADDAVAAYTNLKNWYTAHNNFWVGTGPYYLDKADPTAKTATMTRYTAFPYPANEWDKLSTPMIATVAVDGPASVTTGQEGDFNVSVTYNKAPYPSADIQQVEYLLFDATNTIVNKGTASLVTDGSYKIALTSDITTKLTAGSDKLEIIVVTIPVAIPTFFTQQFVTVAP